MRYGKYGKYEELPEGHQVFEDKYWILLDMVAKEGDIADNEEGRADDGGAEIRQSIPWDSLPHGFVLQYAKDGGEQK
jgi:hypothetical protein